MIHEVDERLRDWVKSLDKVLEVSLGPPTDDATGEGVSLYLLDLRNIQPARTGPRPPQQIVLRYLVTVWGEQPEDAHRILGDLVFSAMNAPEFEIESEPIDPQLWSALGVAPRPAFVMRVPLRKERPAKAAPLVREFMTVDVEPITSLRGMVLGPRDIPLPNVRVELPSLEMVTRTDRRGFFLFPSIPASQGPRRLRLEGKGRAIDVTAEVGDDPIVIRFQPLEE